MTLYHVLGQPKPLAERYITWTTHIELTVCIPVTSAIVAITLVGTRSSVSCVSQFTGACDECVAGAWVRVRVGGLATHRVLTAVAVLVATASVG